MENGEEAEEGFDVDIADKLKVIEKEDHTLGNALRFFVMKNPDVEFCGYTMPHPSEPKMHLRIQTWGDSGTSAFDALRKACDDLVDWCEATSVTFAEALNEFMAQQESNQ